MKKIIFLIALFLSLGIMGCKDDKTTDKPVEKKEYKVHTCCLELYGEDWVKENYAEEGVITYAEKYEAFVLKTNTDQLRLLCPPLEEEFCKEGLKVKVKGHVFEGTEDETGDIKKSKITRFKEYTITKIGEESDKTQDYIVKEVPNDTRHNCCYELYDEQFLEKENLKGTVMYSDAFKEYTISGEKGERYFVCPPLNEEFSKEGLKVKIEGKLFWALYFAISPSDRKKMEEDPDYDIGSAPTYRFRNYTITKIK